MNDLKNTVKEYGQFYESLIKSEKLFRTIVEQAPVALAVISLDGNIEFINKKAEDLFGYRISDILNLDLWWIKAYPDEVYRNEVMTDWNENVENAKKGNTEIIGKEYLVTCKDGTQKMVLFSGVPVMDKMLLVFFDMTERRQMLEALHESEQQYKMISELTTDYVYKLAVHKNGEVTMEFVSDNYYSITGRNKEESGISYWNKIIHPEYMPLLIEQLQKLLLKPQSSEIECKSFIHGNKVRWVNVMSRSEWDEKENRITSIVGAVKDITERKEAELEIKNKTREIEAQNLEYLKLNEKLIHTNKKLQEAKEKAEESDRLKTSFLQNMSHEIRTPMNAIMGFSSLLMDNYDNKPKLEKFSAIINQRCEDLLEIINDILDISKIESGQLSINYEICNLPDLFNELMVFFKEQQKRIGKEDINFQVHISCNQAENSIITDKVKLKQILINLIGNAFKFTNKGRIECGYKPVDDQMLTFYVSDTGIGIPADKHEIIFERFAQLSNDRIRNYGGTGLGLSIVKGLINLLGGSVWLVSESEDVLSGKPGGTTFYFTLPFKLYQPKNGSPSL